MAKLAGFAFFLALQWFSLIVTLVSASALAVEDSTFWEDKLSVLVYRQAVGWDVRHAFQSVVESARGGTHSEKAADLAQKLGEFEAFLKEKYPVKADLWVGPPVSFKQLLQEMLDSKSALACEFCIDLSAARLHGFVYGASLYGGDWAAVEVLA